MPEIEISEEQSRRVQEYLNRRVQEDEAEKFVDEKSGNSVYLMDGDPVIFGAYTYDDDSESDWMSTSREVLTTMRRRGILSIRPIPVEEDSAKKISKIWF